MEARPIQPMDPGPRKFCPAPPGVPLVLHAADKTAHPHAPTLQIICGHRAEILQMRRDCVTKQAKDPLMKASLKKIPPTCTNLFNAEKFTAAVEKAGGVRKCFWPLKKAKIDHLLWKERTTLRELQSLVGLLNFASFTVPKGRLNFRALLSLLNKILMSDHRILHNLPHAAIENLIWWRQNYQQSSAIHMPPPLHFLTTDASDIAWGARLDNLSLSGLWSEAEKDLHCNQKEMIAILRVLEDHCQLLRHKTVLIQSDNKSVVA
ncbi:hypothetical protein PYW07_014256 [Mythimna separata]|uniref:Reverse transcriptase RNase H-like domain-containing protein n=1 Tax=Mythimna separata TaxID=271217 RepID=A0AAD8DYV4_MYTSE|nr:hypothetical protein PYW07_014256 [Mythimna separata]